LKSVTISTSSDASVSSPAIFTSQRVRVEGEREHLGGHVLGLVPGRGDEHPHPRIGRPNTSRAQVGNLLGDLACRERHVVQPGLIQVALVVVPAGQTQPRHHHPVERRLRPLLLGHLQRHRGRLVLVAGGQPLVERHVRVQRRLVAE
jgi:hypothetical protein